MTASTKKQREQDWKELCKLAARYVGHKDWKEVQHYNLKSIVKIPDCAYAALEPLEIRELDTKMKDTSRYKQALKNYEEALEESDKSSSEYIIKFEDMFGDNFNSLGINKNIVRQEHSLMSLACEPTILNNLNDIYDTKDLLSASLISSCYEDLPKSYYQGGRAQTYVEYTINKDGLTAEVCKHHSKQ